MLLKYFYNDTLSHASYLVGSEATREAIIIDPGRDIELYLQEAARQQMRIIAAAETHIHADFVSGARELAEQIGAKLYLSDEGAEPWKYHYLDGYNYELVKEGSIFYIDLIKFQVLHTPGHTPEHIAFLVTDTVEADQPIGIFTGDFVLAGDVGRPDLLEAAAGFSGAAELGARQMFTALQRFKALPDFIQVWPAHGAGSLYAKAPGAVPSSTAGYEKRFNWALRIEDEAAFVEALLHGQPEVPHYFSTMKGVNKEGPTLLKDRVQPEKLDLAQLQAALAEGLTIVDTRPAHEFAARHIPGTINIPLNSSFTGWAGWLLDYNQPFYLILEPEAVPQVVRELAYIGLDNLGGYFEPAVLDRWQSAGKALQSYAVQTPAEVANQVFSGEVTLLDVRSREEWQEGHIPGAAHVPLGHLLDRLAAIPASLPVVVQCYSGARSAIGASLLQAKGFTQVINLAGGYRQWLANGLPTAVIPQRS